MDGFPGVVTSGARRPDGVTVNPGQFPFFANGNCPRLALPRSQARRGQRVDAVYGDQLVWQVVPLSWMSVGRSLVPE
jgi:hypothetical protein